jgi:hypothetical protein
VVECYFNGVTHSGFERTNLSLTALMKICFIIKFCKHMPVHNVCQLMNVSNYKVWKLLDIYVDEARFNQDLSNIDTFGLDETSDQK